MGAGGIGLFAAMLLGVAPLTAQQPRTFEPIDSGQVIRFQVRGVVARGRLLSTLHHTSDSVSYCRLPGPPCSGQIESWQVGWVQPRVLEGLEAQVGTNAAKGARIGIVVGSLLTLAGYGLGQSFCEYQCLSDTDILIRSLLIGSAWGGGIGALFGSGSARMERRF
jgi:hypothetical protein